jgi:hypothetical protein
MTEETTGGGSPRMLRLTFELAVPPGLKRNIQFTRIEQACEQITTAVEIAVRSSFPWAHQITVKPEYSYTWWAPSPRTIPLPDNYYNTVK